MAELKDISLALINIVLKPMFGPPPEIILDKFEQHKKNDDWWFSASFCTHIAIYKMCLGTDTNRWGEGKGTCAGVAVVW